MEGFIFDLDGTLLDSNGVWEDIDREILSECGVVLTDDELHAAAAMTYEQVLELFLEKGIKKYTLTGLKNELDRRAQLHYEKDIPLKEGAAGFLRQIKDRGGRIALVTASPERLYAPALKRNDVWELFDLFISVEETGLLKDKPQIYLLAAENLGIEPCRCAVFDDIPSCIDAAKKAGMYTAAVYDYASKEHETALREKADIYIRNWAGLPSELLP